MVDRAGDIVMEKFSGRVGRVVGVNGDRVTVRFRGGPGGSVDREFKKKKLKAVVEARDLPPEERSKRYLVRLPPGIEAGERTR